MNGKRAVPSEIKTLATELGLDFSNTADKYRRFADNCELRGDEPTIASFKRHLADNRPSMKSYWKAAHRNFRKIKNLTFGPSNSAINLAAADGTTWFMAAAAFKALNIAFGHSEPWTGPRQYAYAN